MNLTTLARWAALALAAAVASVLADTPPLRKVIVDQDGGGTAVLMALQDSHLQVLGITEVTGDGWVKQEDAEVLRMLELIGRTDVPVYSGATYPLINSEESTKRW